MSRRISSRLWLVVLVLSAFPLVVSANEGEGPVRVGLVAAPGSTTDTHRIGVRFILDPGWHIYAADPGDVGLPTRIRWSIGSGAEFSAVEWPTPERFEYNGMQSFGYSGEATLWSNLKFPQASGVDPIILSGRVSWLACKNECLRGSAVLERYIDPKTGLLTSVDVTTEGGVDEFLARVSAMIRAPLLACALIVTLASLFALVVSRLPRNRTARASLSSGDPTSPAFVEWEAFSSHRLRELLENRIPIVIGFAPDSNDKRTDTAHEIFESDEILYRLRKAGVVLLRADGASALMEGGGSHEDARRQEGMLVAFRSDGRRMTLSPRTDPETILEQLLT